MDINLASLAGNLSMRKRDSRIREAPASSRRSGIRRFVAAISVLVAVVGL
jgi:hypothetical protein